MSMERSESCVRCWRFARARSGRTFFRETRSRGKYFRCCLLCSSSPSVASYDCCSRAPLLLSRSHVTPLAKLLEAALFASAVPVAADALRAMAVHADDGETTLESALEELRNHYDTEGHGVELVEV